MSATLMTNTWTRSRWLRARITSVVAGGVLVAFALGVSSAATSGPVTETYPMRCPEPAKVRLVVKHGAGDRVRIHIRASHAEESSDWEWFFRLTHGGTVVSGSGEATAVDGSWRSGTLISKDYRTYRVKASASSDDDTSCSRRVTLHRG